VKLAAGVVLGVLLTISVQVWAITESNLSDGSLIYILTKDEMDQLKANIMGLLVDRNKWRELAGKVGCT
jgi:hypothetical protein